MVSLTQSEAPGIALSGSDESGQIVQRPVPLSSAVLVGVIRNQVRAELAVTRQVLCNRSPAVTLG